MTLFFSHLPFHFFFLFPSFILCFPFTLCSTLYSLRSLHIDIFVNSIREIDNIDERSFQYLKFVSPKYFFLEKSSTSWKVGGS